jgi:pimeloyl-ACP methyl ester carboxylesterase
LLGFGASEKAAATYDFDLWVEQVYDFWQTFVGQPVVLVGNSIGSMVCLAIAAAHPEMVKGIVMLNLPDSSVLENPPWVNQTLSFLKPVTQPSIELTKWIFTTPFVFNLLFWLIRHPRLIRLWARQAYSSPAAVTDELLEILSVPAYDRGAARILRKMVKGKSGRGIDYSAKTVLPNLHIPMLLFWGMKDMMVPPKLAPLFLKYNANLKLIEIENAGHCPHDECPEFVNREILSWINDRVEHPEVERSRVSRNRVSGSSFRRCCPVCGLLCRTLQRFAVQPGSFPAPETQKSGPDRSL